MLVLWVWPRSITLTKVTWSWLITRLSKNSSSVSLTDAVENLAHTVVQAQRINTHDPAELQTFRAPSKPPAEQTTELIGIIAVVCGREVDRAVLNSPWHLKSSRTPNWKKKSKNHKTAVAIPGTPVYRYLFTIWFKIWLDIRNVSLDPRFRALLELRPLFEILPTA